MWHGSTMSIPSDKTMSKPDLTIIIPVYNVRDYIQQCAHSLLHQTYRDFQCIFVDDGCKDDSISLVEPLIEADDRFTIIHKTNGGLSDARNYAFDQIKTPYVTFLDSDDWIEDDHYQKMMEKIHQGCDLVVCDVMYRYQDDPTKDFLMHGLTNWQSKDDNHKGILSPMFAWNKIYASHWFTNDGLVYPKGLWYEDLPVSTLIFATAKRIGYCDTTAVNYRQRQGSIMSNTTGKRLYEIFTILEMVRTNFKNHGLYENYHDELEYLHIEHLRLYGMFRFLRSENAADLYHKSNEVLNKVFPNYKRNPYLANLPLKYRLFIRHTALLKGLIH